MFSIIIPLYNKSGFISRALDSVLHQSFTDFEVIVINDGSTDGSEKTVEKKYGSKVKLVHQKNQGVSAARNTGIQLAQRDYISFLDADDIWHSDYLSFVHQAIIAKDYPGIIGTDFKRFKSFERLTDPELDNIMGGSEPILKTYTIADFFNQAINHTLTFTSAIVIKRSFFEKNAGFDPLLRLGEDLDFWFRAILYYKELIFLQNKLVYYSREDFSAATKKNYLLEQTLIPKIITDDYFPLSEINNPKDLLAFKAFRIKWICLRLPPTYRLKENQASIKRLIPKLGNRFFVFKWVYFLPFRILNLAFTRKYPYKLWAKYLKFSFRYF
ncbi:MAG: glycosyltransferase family A protein [Candidatus Paceibacterota bacterium]